jgi:soluble lytic murein transglycosylase-like protein
VTRFLQPALLVLVLTLTPLYIWWNPSAPVPSNVRAFGPVEVEKFRQQEKEHVQLLRETRAAAAVLASGGCRNDGLAESAARYARAYHLPARIVAATIFTESSCRPEAISDAGAVGLMQVNTRVWPYSRREMLDPDRNLQVGTAILAQYVQSTGNLRDGLRLYFGVSPDSTASDEYADKVLSMARR